MLSHFQGICDDLPQVRELAAAIDSPNPEDDRLIRIAIAVFPSCLRQRRPARMTTAFPEVSAAAGARPRFSIWKPRSMVVLDFNLLE